MLILVTKIIFKYFAVRVRDIRIRGWRIEYQADRNYKYISVKKVRIEYQADRNYKYQSLK